MSNVGIEEETNWDGGTNTTIALIKEPNKWFSMGGQRYKNKENGDVDEDFIDGDYFFILF